MPVEITEATTREITPAEVLKLRGHALTIQNAELIGAHMARIDPVPVAALCDDWLRMREALTWYAEQAEGCRKLTREGDTARHALDADGGKRARSALSQATGKTK